MLENLQKYMNRNSVINAYAYTLLNDHDLLNVYYNDNNIVVGYILAKNSALIINFNTYYKDNLDDARVSITKYVTENSLTGFECDKYTLDLLYKDFNFKSLYTETENYFAYLNKKTVIDKNYDYIVPLVTERDKYMSLQAKCFGDDRKVAQRDFRKEEALTKIILQNDSDEFIFACGCTGFSYDVSMIEGVVTHPDYRNKGIATNGVKFLCNKLINKNITPVLYYNNLNARKIYLNLGFIEIEQKYYQVRKK